MEETQTNTSTISPSSEDERTWGMIVHLSSLSGFVLGFGWLVAPLVIWLVKRDEMPFVAQEGKNALNFQISMLIIAVVSGILVMILVGIFGLIAVGIMQLVFPIIAGLKAKEGGSYRYPLTYEFIK